MKDRVESYICWATANEVQEAERRFEVRTEMKEWVRGRWRPRQTLLIDPDHAGFPYVDMLLPKLASNRAERNILRYLGKIGRRSISWADE